VLLALSTTRAERGAAAGALAVAPLDVEERLELTTADMK
jgi:hypothetical protein